MASTMQHSMLSTTDEAGQAVRRAYAREVQARVNTSSSLGKTLGPSRRNKRAVVQSSSSSIQQNERSQEWEARGWSRCRSGRGQRHSLVLLLEAQQGALGEFGAARHTSLARLTIDCREQKVGVVAVQETAPAHQCAITIGCPPEPDSLLKQTEQT